MSEAHPVPEAREACVRCLRPNYETAHARFIWRGRCYVVPLCSQHSQMIDRDFAVWTRVARELTMERRGASSPPAPPEVKPRPVSPVRPVPAVRTAPERRQEPDRRRGDRRAWVHAPLIVARGEVIDLDGGRVEPVEDESIQLHRIDPSEPIPGWSFTDHALQRMLEREISPGAVWRTLRQRDSIIANQSTTPQGNPGLKLRGPEASLVISTEEQVILTVGYGQIYLATHPKGE